MADDLESVRARIKREYRAMAESHTFKQFPEFERMCLSDEGFEPATGHALLAAHAKQDIARHLIAACQELGGRWHANLKPEPTDVADGPVQIFIKLFAASEATQIAEAQWMGDEVRRHPDSKMAEALKRAMEEGPQ